MREPREAWLRGFSRCDRCNKSFEKKELEPVEEAWLCASCKEFWPVEARLRQEHQRWAVATGRGYGRSPLMVANRFGVPTLGVGILTILRLPCFIGCEACEVEAGVDWDSACYPDGTPVARALVVPPSFFDITRALKEGREFQPEPDPRLAAPPGPEQWRVLNDALFGHRERDLSIDLCCPECGRRGKVRQAWTGVRLKGGYAGGRMLFEVPEGFTVFPRP